MRTAVFEKVPPRTLQLNPWQRQKPEPELWDLWFTISRQRWSLLALVSGDRDEAPTWIAEAMAKLDRQQGRETRVLCAQGITNSAEILEQVGSQSAGQRTIVALDSVVLNPAGLPVVMQADRAVLCATLGQTDLASARRILDLVGRRHFIGCVTVRSSP